MNVVVIESSASDFRLIERGLGKGFTLHHVRTVAEGLDVANAGGIDLAIVDLTLPEGAGYATFLKARSALVGTPILVLSGLKDDELAVRAMWDGAQDVVAKSELRDFPIGRVARRVVERRRVRTAAGRDLSDHRAMFDNLPMAAFACDAEGRITYFNQKALALWGRAPRAGEASDRYCGPAPIFAPDDSPASREDCWMARAIREGREYAAQEIVVERAGGERCLALASATPLLDSDGTVRGAVGVLVDVTAQRRAEQAAYEAERFARATVNSLGAHIAILDEAGTIVWTNTAWDRFALDNGMPAKWFARRADYLDVCDRSEGEDADIARAAAAGIRAVLRHERDVYELEYPCHSPSEERWFCMRATRFGGEGATRVVVSHENISSRRKAERLEREKLSLHEAVKGMEQVLGVVAHELRTPLASLRAISEFLVTDGAQETGQWEGFVRDIGEEVDRMSDTVNNLLEAARLNSGRARWNWGEVDLAAACEDALECVRPLVDDRRVTLSLEVDHAVRRMAGDGDALRRLVTNLLSNARKHTDRGTIGVRVVDRGSDAEGHRWLDISVADTGSGIPPEILARLGEAFALNAGVVGGNHVSGTGLGLAICKGIAAAHGGTLRFESTLGVGTTITARVRADLPEGDTIRLHQEQVTS